MAASKYFKEFMAEQTLADAHSHIDPEWAWHAAPLNFLNIIAYTISDLVSAGMSKDRVHQVAEAFTPMKVSYGTPGPKLTSEEQWEEVKPYWPYVKGMGSGMEARRAMKIFFDVDDLNDETYKIIDAKLPEIQKRSYADIYGEHKVDRVMGVSVGGSRFNNSEGLVSQQLYSDTYTQPVNRDNVQILEEATGMPIYSLDSYVAALDELLDREFKAGMVGVKWHITSFMRANEFGIANKFDAEVLMDKILTGPTRGSLFSGFMHSYEEMEPLHAYLQNHLVQKCIEYDAPIQIHSGTFGCTNGNKLQNSNTTLLGDMFLRYPQAKFDILHSSWPYYMELGEIVRQFPNVSLNTTWMQILSPLTFKRYMKELACWVPANKIFAFGCDEFNVLNSCACAEIYRDIMAEVLTELVEEGWKTEAEAIEFAKLVSHDNVWSHWTKIK